MPKPTEPSFADYWYRQASRLALKLNFHHWLARVIPKLFVALALLAIFELFRREVAGPFRWSVGLFLLSLAVVLAWGWGQARRHFCTTQQALVRLETVLGLHNRLSAAQDGVVAWPAPPEETRDGYVENWKVVLLPLLAGGLFLWAAHLIPVSHLKVGTSTEAIAEPPEFAQVQNWIHTLKAEDLIEPEKLQDLQTALNKLRDRPPEDWYKQGDMEAANSLKELMAQAMNTLAQDLSQADRAVQAMREQTEAGENGNSSSLQPLRDELRKAGENLSSGTMPLKREMLGQLTGGEKAGEKALSPEQLKSLHERLQKGAADTMTAANTNGGLSKEMKAAMDRALQGMGQGELDGANPGGTGGGKKSAPMELHGRDQLTTPGSLTAVSSEDLSRAALGETLKVSASEHSVDPATYRGTQNAGNAQVQGTGGEAVWRSTYDPQEAETLSRFFK